MPTQRAIAVVEDHADLAASLVDVLAANDWDARAYASAEAFRFALDGFVPAVALVDLNLPGEDGVSLARFLRDEHPEMGVVMLTARAGLDDRQRGYQAGADVYVPKPSTPDELLTILERLWSRLSVGPTEPEAAAQLDVARMRLIGPDGSVVSLTAREMDLLESLSQAGEHGLGVEEIGALDPSWAASKASLEVAVARLRQKLGSVGIDGRTVVAVRGHGYRLAVTLHVVRALR